MNPNHNRQGYTLIEMLFVISVAVVVMMVNVVWIHQTMKFSSLMKQRQQHHQNLRRLAWELRDDIRSSRSISMVGENRLKLERNDGTETTYTISDFALNVESRDNASTIKREKFALSPSSIIYWDTSELPNWISLFVARGPQVLANPSIAETASFREDSAVDLHVRVSPNRWKVATVEQDTPLEKREVTQ